MKENCQNNGHSSFRGIKSRLAAMPLFWKAYLFVVVLLIAVVGLAEFTIEPAAEALLEGISGGFQPWHEAVIWVVVILSSSLACGYILSTSLTRKLDRMVRAYKALTRGNLRARLPVLGNERDAFDVLSRNFNEMAVSIEAQLRHERKLLADISHELRSPLTRMTIAVELLERRRGEDEHAAVLSRLEREVERMNELVSALLDQARESLTAQGGARTVDLSRLLSELAADFAFQGEAQQKTIGADIEKGLAVHGEAALLQRLFGNLLSNAVFYAPEGGEVWLAAAREGGEVRVVIRDFGPGVPDDQLEDIFRAFYRVDGSRSRQSGGAGLGLAIAREAAVRHGGSIMARNAGPGLEMTVVLPVGGNGNNGDGGGDMGNGGNAGGHSDNAGGNGGNAGGQSSSGQ